MFLLFSGEDYYPYGGAEDFRASFETVDEAMEAFDIDDLISPWANILDLESGVIVKTYDQCDGWYDGAQVD